MSKLTEIQNELKAKKSCYNKFGKYYYRKCEDILEALKPLLKKHDASLTISDEVGEVGFFEQHDGAKANKHCFPYVESTVLFVAGEESFTCKAQAGIEKAGGMALPQAFGSASSYARKYALGAMFLLDDTEDADATNQHDDKPAEKPAKAKMTKEDAYKLLAAPDSLADLKKAWDKIDTPLKADPDVIARKDEAKNVIENNT